MYYLLSACAFEDNKYGINKQYFGKVRDTHCIGKSDIRRREDSKIPRDLFIFFILKCRKIS